MRELVEGIKKQDPNASFRIQASALEALHEATEAYVIAFLFSKLTCIISEHYLSEMLIFQDSNLLAIHAKRVTIQQKDMMLCKQLMSNFGVGPSPNSYASGKPESS